MVVNHEMIATEAYSRFRDFHAILVSDDLYAWEADLYRTLPADIIQTGMNETIVANVPVPNMF
jgi:hypothetical protein